MHLYFGRSVYIYFNIFLTDILITFLLPYYGFQGVNDLQFELTLKNDLTFCLHFTVHSAEYDDKN